jgi:hypothetical protein
MGIFAIKLAVADTEKAENKSFLVNTETYARAEEMAYEVAESLDFKSFVLVEVVKKQIREVLKDIDPEQTMWLVKYEFGLEAKPEKSNLLVSGATIHEAGSAAFSFLDPLCNSLFITSINKTDFMDYVKDSKLAEVEEEEEEFAL